MPCRSDYLGMKPDREDFEQFGWNTPQHNNPLLFERSVLALLSNIGIVLTQIRDAGQARCQCGLPLSVQREIDGRVFAQCERRASEFGHDSVEMTWRG